ncbi:RNA polymerase sigma factor [Brumicola pallidula]|uniref:DNA-directed RNA polymerase specialized sigma subunit n=1 Tax=Brumicola pallidula DSM 14239 = ACAM 615 TaxID=1121922 RepID=K6ZXS2_9ALTE|nr:RNA polymerase sigma factor [Glaciecola pallidula]GAC28115.1 DNA-directed RNA polymerase specialized sigma subunit [Glaciecola pallidula DSM 14239 = ACAM 615]
MNSAMKVNIAKLAQQYGRKVFQSAFRILNDTHLAEDVVQEVFLKLFKKSTESFDKISNWQGYLKSMAISTAIDQLRRHKRLAEEPIEDESPRNIDGAKQPLQQVLLQRDLAQFKIALVNMHPQDAEIFCLRHIEGYTYQEIGGLLDMTSNAVGVCLHRTQQKLSSQLPESQFFGEQKHV